MLWYGGRTNLGDFLRAFFASKAHQVEMFLNKIFQFSNLFPVLFERPVRYLTGYDPVWPSLNIEYFHVKIGSQESYLKLRI